MVFKDNAEMPIIAIDFDDTINIGGLYPICGVPREFSVQVISFMRKLGIKVVIWTSRDSEEDMEYMKDFMDSYNIEYDDINSSFKYAPYNYESRKVYAHMYVDDRGYNWDGDTSGYDMVFINVLKQFLVKVCRFPQYNAYEAKMLCMNGKDPEQWMIEAVKNWKNPEVPEWQL